jgi:hypothetical protein
MLIPRSDTAEFRIARSPSRLSIFLAAIFSSAPSQPSNSFVRAAHSVMPFSLVVLRPAMRSFRASTCCLPPMAARAAFLSSSVHPDRAAFTCCKVFSRPMNFPLESNADMPSLPIISPACPVPVVRFTMTAFRAVPASEPLMPRFASTPRAVADSVIGTLKLFIVPPTPR